MASPGTTNVYTTNVYTKVQQRTPKLPYVTMYNDEQRSIYYSYITIYFAENGNVYKREVWDGGETTTIAQHITHTFETTRYYWQLTPEELIFVLMTDHASLMELMKQNSWPGKNFFGYEVVETITTTISGM
jgi:hypothetical protein